MSYKEVLCDYCGEKAGLINSSKIYGTDYGMIWICKPCDAYAGVNKSRRDYKPLGRLANKELRSAKKIAYDSFIRLCDIKMVKDGCSKKEAKQAGYKWLASVLDIESNNCQFPKFNIDICKRVEFICNNITQKINS